MKLFYNQLMILLFLVVYQFKIIFPYWIAGVITGSLISVFGSAKIKRIISGIDSSKYNFGAALCAALSGVAFPVCMYGTIPLIASLGKKGVPQYILATFMISSILLNPNLFLISFALGTPVAIVRFLTCILAGLAAGILVKCFFKRDTLFNFSGFTEKEQSNEELSVKRFVKDLHRSIMITAPYFLAGILITALFDRFFPKELLVSLFGRNNGLGVFLATSMGVPAYLCGGGTIPLIREWLQSGMSPGSAIAFMISGPATKLTNLGAVKVILGARNFILYITFSITVAVIAGFTTDFIHRLIK